MKPSSFSSLLEVRSADEMVILKIGEDEAPPMSWKQAWKVGEGLRRLPAGEMSGFKAVYDDDSRLTFELLGAHLLVGIFLYGYENHVLIPQRSIADLCRQFRRAAEEAKYLKLENDKAKAELIDEFSHLAKGLD